MQDNQYYIYDFDGTIYDGDSSIDFFFYTLYKYPYLIVYIYIFLFNVVLYLCKKISKEQLKEAFFYPILKNKRLEKTIKEFWEKNERKIKKFFIEKEGNKIIISASPDFLLRYISNKYDSYLIATIFDIDTKKIIGKNCLGEEKVNRLDSYLKCKNYEIVEFYSDSDNDLPLAKISKVSYKVRGERITLWEVYR